MSKPESYASVWDAIADTPEQAANLRARAELMQKIGARLKKHDWTQAEETAFIKSLNWTTENFTETRDYAIVTSHPHEVEDVVKCFEADWHRKPYELREDSHLIWCKGNGRERVAHFIDETKHTLFVQNERYQDAVIIERLVRAKERGVKVHVMARPPHTLKKDKLVEGVGGLRILDDVGIEIHKLKKLRLHRSEERR